MVIYNIRTTYPNVFCHTVIYSVRYALEIFMVNIMLRYDIILCFNRI